MEEYIHLYHQKLWEIAFANVRDTLFNQNTISWGLLIYLFYIILALLERNKKTCSDCYLYSFCLIHSLSGSRVSIQL